MEKYHPRGYRDTCLQNYFNGLIVLTIIAFYLVWHSFLNDRITFIYLTLAIAILFYMLFTAFQRQGQEGIDIAWVS
jgi:heme/copper-type cytochrome/quinol oxidase subunit 4